MGDPHNSLGWVILAVMNKEVGSGAIKAVVFEDLVSAPAIEVGERCQDVGPFYLLEGHSAS
jgi:hypothetical protein